MQDAKYLAYGLLVLACYWFTVQRGLVFFSAEESPSAPSAQGGGGRMRSHPTFWGGGFQGGK